MYKVQRDKSLYTLYYKQMNMKISRFAKFFKADEDHFLAYSTRTNMMFVLSNQLYFYCTRNEDGEIDLSYFDNAIINNLVRSKIIASEMDDDTYIKDLQFQTQQYNFSQESISLIVAPTTKCNFRCFYCFEPNKDQRTMSNETIENLINFINRHEVAKNISIICYGGEPLLALDEIERILMRMELTGKKLVNHEIITNGYYFDDKAIDLFSKYPLDKIQITLDGNKERHDSIRSNYRTRDTSFDRIVANMERILECLPKTLLSIRVNIEKSTQNQYNEINKFLLNKFSKNTNFDIYPGILRLDNDNSDDLSDKAMSIADTALFTQKWCNCNNENYPQIAKKSCTASRVNAYVIGPDGEIYKCWNDVTDRSKVVASINNNAITNKQLMYDYLLSTLWFESEKCKNCAVLPICYGGCPWYKVRNLRNKAHFNTCSIYANDEFLKSCLMTRYKQTLNSKQ